MHINFLEQASYWDTLTIVGTMFSPQVLTALLCIICIQVVYGGGKLEVKFVRYVNPGGAGDNGNCCDGFSVCFSSCDHEFTLCIDNVSGPDSISSCKYGVKRSGEISEANTIDFYNKVGIQDNPMVFSFDSWPGAVKVKVDVWDLDDSSSHDFVDFLSRLFASSPSPDVNRAKWYEFQLKRRTTLSSQIRVYCDTHYYGEFCNKSCIPSASDETGHYYCDSEGNLVCKQHYFGSKCTRYCEPHNDSNGHYACDLDTGDLVCLEGWKGSNCLEDIDECTVNNSTKNSTEHGAAYDSDACSFHGNCTNLEGDYKCTCEEHYTGETCAEIKLYCSNTTCANNGTCMNSFGGYMCHCNDKWTGKHCEIELTPCTYYPCQNNGVCNIQGDSYNCTCDERFTGDHCETEVTITTTATTERVQVVSEDSIIVFLVGYLNDSDNNVLIEGIKSLVQEYGNFNGDITLEVVKHKVTLKDGGELTQVEITAVCTTANIDGLLARIFREHALEELDRYLPLQLYNGKVDPYTPPQYQEKSWVSQYWFVILIIILVVLVIVGGVVVFFFIRKRRHDTFKNKLAGDSSGVDEISPDTAIGFDNSLYFNVNQPERVSGLSGTTHGEQS